MKKRIIFVGLCFVLLLVFTSLSYAGYDARAIPVKAHPDQELLTPRHWDQLDRVLLLITPASNGLFFGLYVQSYVPGESNDSQGTLEQKIEHRMPEVETLK